MTVAIVGGGAVGLTTARVLAADGWDVTVYDAGTVGGGSTGRAAGIVYAAHADPLDAEMGRRSVGAFRELSGTGSFTFDPTPYVWFVTESGRDADAINDHVERMHHHDIPVTSIEAADLGRRFPDLHTDDIETAAITGAAGRIDTTAYASVLADSAREAGATIVEETSVTVDIDSPVVETPEERRPVDAVAVTAGPHTKAILAEAGVAIPMKPYRVQALTVEGSTTPMFWDATTGYYARPHPTGVLAGDGTTPVEADPDAWQRTADPEFESVMTDRLKHRIGDVGTPTRAWAGLCTATPDGDPLLGKLCEGVYVGTGWHGHGVMRAPATGGMLATAIEAGRSPEERFDPQRFSGDEQFEIREGMTL